MKSPFITGGPIPETAFTYIKREADNQIRGHIEGMNYVTIIEPRQQGKTSFVYRMLYEYSSPQHCFVYVYLDPQEAMEKWYRMICKDILEQLFFISEQDWPNIALDAISWRSFLRNIASYAKKQNIYVVIIFDEIGVLDFNGATEFFSVLRGVFNRRGAIREFQHLTFWLVGTFNPRDLIQDDRISPFNIAHNIQLPDFSIEQLYELVSHGNWTQEELKMEITEAIYYWTNGQPYLSQLVCSYLEQHILLDFKIINSCVEKLRREDQNHIPSIIRRLNQSEILKDYIYNILAGEFIDYYPLEDSLQAQLTLLGVIKGGQDNNCIIRNRIYEQTLQQIYFNSDKQLLKREWISLTDEELIMLIYDYYPSVYNDLQTGMTRKELINLLKTKRR